MKNHYVYKLIDRITGEFYYGSRSYNGDASNDRYMGSYKVWNPNISNLDKIIIKEWFDSRQSAIEYESILIEAEINNTQNKNYHIPASGKFTTIGTITCYDVEDNSYKNIPLDEYKDNNSGRYVTNASKHGKGKSNSQYGSMWITNGHIQYKIKNSDTIPIGFTKGRLNYIWIHNVETLKNSRVVEGAEIPDGFALGRIYKMNDEVKKKALANLNRGTSLGKRKDRVVSCETKEKISSSLREYYTHNYNSTKGMNLSDNHKSKISNSMKNRWSEKKDI